MLSKYIDDKQIDMVAKIENVVNKLIADNKYNVFEKQIDALIDLKIDFNVFIKVIQSEIKKVIRNDYFNYLIEYTNFINCLFYRIDGMGYR